MPFNLMWEMISVSFPQYTKMGLGLALLTIVYLIPNGITGLFKKYLKRGTA